MQYRKSYRRSQSSGKIHDDVIKWNYFPRHWNYPHKGQWRDALMFSLIWTWIWVNNREAGDVRRHRAHYDVSVMYVYLSFSRMERIFLILWHILCSELGYISAAPMRSRHFVSESSLMARLMGPTWGPSGADRTQVGPMLAPWTLLSGMLYCNWVKVFPHPNGHELLKMFYTVCECVPRFVTHYWCVSMELQKLVGYVKIHYLITYSRSSQAWAKIFITQMCRFAHSSGRMKTRFFSCMTNFITCESNRPFFYEVISYLTIKGINMHRSWNCYHCI